MKRCGSCGETKSLDAFFARGGGEQGYRSMCKSCYVAARRQRRQDDPAKASAAIAAYRARNPDKVAAWIKNRDPAQMRDNAARYRERNREVLRARRLERYRQNIEDERRRARIQARGRRVGRNAESLAYADLLRSDPCSYCGGCAGAIDHIHPRARAGGNEWMNLTAACRSCNSSKGDERMLLFLGRSS